MSILHNSKALDIGYFACRFGEWRHLPVAPARSVEPLKMRRWLPNVAPCPDRLPRQDCSPRHAHALPLGQPPPPICAALLWLAPKSAAALLDGPSRVAHRGPHPTLPVISSPRIPSSRRRAGGALRPPAALVWGRAAGRAHLARLIESA